MSAGTWSYDGSFEGLLILAAKAAEEGEAPYAVANALAPEGELFALLGPPPLEFPAGRDHTADALTTPSAEKAASYLRALSCDLFDLVLHTWMSEENLETSLLQICAEVGRRGWAAIRDYRDLRVREVHQASRRVTREIHRLIGLARFSRRSDGLWSAPLEPDHNVITALVPHFTRRFNGECFAVIDVKRRLAVRSNAVAIETFAGQDALGLLPDKPDQNETILWKRYFKAAENPARANSALQRRLMPVRYWKYLPEITIGSTESIPRKDK
jgi:probable DNA metabolism protein